MKHINLFIIVTGHLLWMARVLDGASAEECELNWQCPPNYFCYLPSKTCSPCTICSVYNREQSSWKKCVTSPNECGSCKPGFEEEILSGGKVRELCLPVEPTISDKQQTVDDGISSIPPYWFGIIIGICVVTALVGVAHITKIRRQAGRQENGNPQDEELGLVQQPPPPYEVTKGFVPTAPSLTQIKCGSFPSSSYSSGESLSTSIHQPTISAGRTDDIFQQAQPFRNPDYLQQDRNYQESLPDEGESLPTSTHQPTMTFSQRTDDIFQQAQPYRNPDYLQYDHNSMQDSLPDEAVSNEVNHSDREDPFIDDETQPSSWSPGIDVPGQICENEAEGDAHQDRNDSDSDNSEEGSRRKRQRLTVVNLHQTINFSQQMQNQNVNSLNTLNIVPPS